jgi:hypothetical protein
MTQKTDRLAAKPAAQSIQADTPARGLERGQAFADRIEVPANATQKQVKALIDSPGLERDRLAGEKFCAATGYAFGMDRL